MLMMEVLMVGVGVVLKLLKTKVVVVWVVRMLLLENCYHL